MKLEIFGFIIKEVSDTPLDRVVVLGLKRGGEEIEGSERDLFRTLRSKGPGGLR